MNYMFIRWILIINLTLFSNGFVFVQPRSIVSSLRSTLQPITSISSDQLLEAMNWRYASKLFDAEKKVPDHTWKALEESLRLTPSSYGLQPWKFIVVTNHDARVKLRANSYGQSQVTDASHFVVLARRSEMTEDDIDRYVNQIVVERNVDKSKLEGYRQVMVNSIVKGLDKGKQQEWASRQVYIALGQLMASAALLAVDACPLEGIVPAQFDEILSLKGTGYETVVACAVGYRSKDDKLAAAKKIRYPAEDIFIHI